MIMLPLLCFGQHNSFICHQVDFNEDGVYFNIDTLANTLILSQKSETLDLNIPLNNKSNVNLSLSQVQLLTDDCRIINRSSSQLTPINAKFYRGHISGDPASTASISIFRDQISGVIHTPQGIYSFAKIPGESLHFMHKRVHSDVQDFECQTLGEYNPVSKYNNESFKSNSTCTVPVEIFLECDFDMYQSFGDIDATVAYATSLFNEVASLYDIENITLQISSIAVWTTDDGYTDNTEGILDFGSDLLQNGFPGHFAHLLTNDPGSNGGIAYIDMFCGATPFAYSDITNNMSNFPDYSWDVQVVAHELGHNFGSPHTHDCVWGPNGDEQIDDCGNEIFGGDVCYDSANPIIPTTGGTVMSYCHLNAVGINFNEGFGQQPGDLIRQKMSDCLCDNATCNSAELIVADSVYHSHPDHGNGATSHNATHADWYYFVPENDGMISVMSCGENVDTRLWLYTGDCQSLSYQLLSDDDCDMGNGNTYASSITDYAVSAGVSYYIEWDDRWTTSAFDWQFIFTPSSNLEPCDDTNIMATGNLVDSIYNAKIKITSDGLIPVGEEIMFKAGQEVELMSGFEIQLGATIESTIEDCADN